MLKNIKSSFFLKILFSYVNLKQKFEILKHNKDLQKSININNLYYQLFSGRYIVYAENGEAKEYDGMTDGIVFIGEYLNGRRNGKGREYKGIKIVFEGEYLNGKRSGKGKEYIDDYRGKFIYEGEYLNGMRNGKGKAYDYDDNLIFESEYKNNKRNGNHKNYVKGKLILDYDYLDDEIIKGKKYDLNGNLIKEIKENGLRKDIVGGKLMFEGEYLNGKKNGKCKEYLYYSKGKIILEAEYLNGKKNGKIKSYYNNGNIMFEGEYLNDKPWNMKTYDENGNLLYELKNGKGKVRTVDKTDDENELLFSDLEVLDGVAHGKGKQYNIYGQLLSENEYLCGKVCGKLLNYKNNKLMAIFDVDTFIDDKISGNAKLFDENGNLKYEGEIFNNIRIKGKQYVKGKLEFEGEYSFGKKWNGKGYDKNGNIIYELNNGTGKVKEYDDDLLIFDGEYVNGKRTGISKEYNSFGQIVLECEYLNGELISEKFV